MLLCLPSAHFKLDTTMASVPAQPLRRSVRIPELPMTLKAKAGEAAMKNVEAQGAKATTAENKAKVGKAATAKAKPKAATAAAKTKAAEARAIYD